jgi:feruloyl-CoA synthase
MPTFISHDVIREDRPDGAILLRTRVSLGLVARNTGAWLHRWAKDPPDRVLLVERSGQGWRELRYADALGQVRSPASVLLGRGLGPETPIVIIPATVSTTAVSPGLPVELRGFEPMAIAGAV